MATVSEYPSNSHAGKKRQQVNLKPVVTGQVRQPKRNLLQRVNENLIDDDAKSIPEFLMFDVIIPNVKTLIYDLVSIGFSRALFGEDFYSRRTNPYGSYSSPRRTSDSYVPYSSMSRPSATRMSEPRRNYKHNYNNPSMYCDLRIDAENILADLRNGIDMYDEVSYANLYELMGMEDEINAMDWNYGWTNLDSAWIHASPKGGFILELPPARPFE